MRNRTLSLIAILCLAAISVAWSQDTRGTIVGRVTDPSGAVIPGAQVSVTNAAMGTKASLTTNGEGIYVAPLLQPGFYQLEVAAQGFKKAVRKNIEVRVADRLDINIALEIGASDQSVTVTTEIPLLKTESASLGTSVDSKRVSDLPVSYGNPFLLIGLSAGVTYNGSVRLDRPFEPTHIVNFSMGGTSGLLNDVTIDGAPTTSRANAFQVTASYVPPTDIVQEFKVQTGHFRRAVWPDTGRRHQYQHQERHQQSARHCQLRLSTAKLLGQRLLLEQERHTAPGFPVQPLGRVGRRSGLHSSPL